MDPLESHRRQEAIASDVFSQLPESGWAQAAVGHVVVADRDEGWFALIDADGVPVSGTPYVQVDARAFPDLKRSMAAPGTGAWWGAFLLLHADGSFLWKFEYERRVYVGSPPVAPYGEDPGGPSLDEYRIDLERYPRTPEATPEWLRPTVGLPAVLLRAHDPEVVLTPREHQLAAIARQLFGSLGVTAPLAVFPLRDDEAVAVVHGVRGGGTVIVAPDQTVLFTGSALDMAASVAAFREGHRTPREKFVRR